LNRVEEKLNQVEEELYNSKVFAEKIKQPLAQRRSCNFRAPQKRGTQMKINKIIWLGIKILKKR